ncbi:SIMPL domain-containing protein [Sinomonas sp. P47F7]|uniref:SIMPL domain-containing protein n=1 Tax=Sinomonas sp. P47F7 TaxID=3410987 RepID=UPI003BF4A966
MGDHQGHHPDTVTVTGAGTARAVPDAAVVRLAVEVSADALAAAYEGAAAAAQRVVDAALAAGLPRADVATSGLSVRSEVVWRDGNRQEVVGYVASTGLALTARELARTPALLDAIVRAGGDALRIHGLALEVSDPAAAHAAAQEAAFDDARSAAGRLAQLAGRELGDVQRIDASAPSLPGPPVPLMRAALATPAESLPVEAGEAEVRASVTVVWRLDSASNMYSNSGHAMEHADGAS